MNYKIRPIREDDIYLLDTFLYEAIFIPQGVEPPPKDIIKHPDLQIYISDFGQKDDVGFLAEVEGKAVGAVVAVGTRIIHDFAHLDDETPSLSISVLKDYRNLGIGKALMEQILLNLKDKGYQQVSLSVQQANYAVNLYQKVGFEVVKENDDDYIMVRQL